MGRLKKALYGTRDAPQLWQKELGSTLKDLGFKDSRLHPGFFYHQGRDIALVSHVDDLLIGGTSEDLVWVRQSIEKKYDIKGTDIENAKDGLKFLGRRIERQEYGYVWSAVPKHREILLDEWGLVNANPVSTPVATENDQDWVTREQAQEMPKDDATKFRRAVARLNYLALDRPDLCVAAGKLSRCMARPREGDEKPLKRMLRYLQGEPLVGIVFRWQPRPSQLVVLTDSDWAGCKVTRRSTTGIVVKLGEHLLCFSSKLQKSVALSSGEAELSAQVGGLTDVLGIKHLFREFGMNLSVRSCCDSSAARGVLTRLGTGKLRHLELKHLWVQEVVARKEVEIHWISRQRNPADVLTHQSSLAEFRRCLRQLGFEFRPDILEEYLSEGRCWNAPTPQGAGQSPERALNISTLPSLY